MKRELRELILMMTDAYKLFHRQMYPKNTVLVYSNGTARSSKHYKGKNKKYVKVFGTQRMARLLKDKFQDFFDLPEDEVIEFCKTQLSSFTGTDYSVDHIIYLHRLQHLPITLKSLPEGSMCPIKVPYMTFYNTDPKCFWLTNYLETFISTEMWHFITNATIASEYRDIFDKWAMKTVGNTDAVKFQGHDFSARGDYGFSAATSVGLAHLTSFCGGDTVTSYLDAQYYYDAPQNDFEKGIITQTSVPASEHSVQCAHYNPTTGDELAYLDALLDEFVDAPVLSIVCDGYDYWKFMTEIVPLRKEKILARSGKVVFRPDSGVIDKIICGEADTIEFVPAEDVKLQNDTSYCNIDNNWYKNVYDDNGKFERVEAVYYNVITAQEKGSIRVLADIFGTYKSEMGYDLLNDKVGLIYGDSVTLEIADIVCRKLYKFGFASINWVAGIGSYTYQFNTRDSHGQAIKATYIELLDSGDKYEGIEHVESKEIFKDPKTGDGLKKSAKGLITVESDSPDENGNRELIMVDSVGWDREKSPNNMLKVILRDGVLYNQVSLEDVRGMRLKRNKTAMAV